MGSSAYTEADAQRSCVKKAFLGVHKQTPVPEFGSSTELSIGVFL